MDEKILNEKESLELISQMIRNTQKRLEDGNGKPFLIFGYTTIVVSMFVYYLLSINCNPYYSNLFWFAIPVVGMSLLFISKKKQTKLAKTFIDRAVTSIWSVIGAAAVFISICAFFVHIPVLPMIILLMGIATTLTGLIIKFQPVIVCGIVGATFCVIPFFMAGIEQILVFALCFFVMMVIPGHILQFKSRKTHV